MSRETIFEALFEKFLVADVYGETIPASAPHTVDLTGDMTPNFFIQDQGVAFVAGGTALTRVWGTPGHGQYCQAGPVYTFAAADAGLNVTVSVLESATFKTASRRLKTWDQVDPLQQPAMFLAETGEDWQQSRGVPVKRTWSVEAYIYVYTGADSALAPSSVLNPILDAIEALLGPDVCGYQTLGGLVSHAWIEGGIQVAEGSQGQGTQAIALVPIKLLVP